RAPAGSCCRLARRYFGAPHSAARLQPASSCVCTAMSLPSTRLAIRCGTPGPMGIPTLDSPYRTTAISSSTTHMTTCCGLAIRRADTQKTGTVATTTPLDPVGCQTCEEQSEAASGEGRGGFISGFEGSRRSDSNRQPTVYTSVDAPSG